MAGYHGHCRHLLLQQRTQRLCIHAVGASVSTTIDNSLYALHFKCLQHSLHAQLEADSMMQAGPGSSYLPYTMLLAV